MIHTTCSVFLFALLIASQLSAGEKPFRIQVIDSETKRGVPLVELKTTNHIRFVTDSNGIIAFDEPGLMNTSVFFDVSSHGYEFAKDGFGIRGKALQVSPGGRGTLEIKRLNIAVRLYRVTGAGIYRDSALTGEPIPIREPLLNSQVVGQDSVVNAVYKGKIHWFWGDTTRPAYPLGNFHAPGATSELPSNGGLDPRVGVDLRYAVDDQGFARAAAKMAGDGPTWIFGLMVLRGQTGKSSDERLFASYMKIKPPLSIYRRGLCEFDDRAGEFKHVVDLDVHAPAHPGGHSFQHKVNGSEYVYFAEPSPVLRVRATADDLRDLTRYECFTCLKDGSRIKAPELDRDSQGKLRYSWKRNTAPVGPREQAELVKSGRIKEHEGVFQFRDAVTGKAVMPHGGSVYWNDYRKRWITIFVEHFGTSLLGEVWYAEADTPLGPWVYATKIVTHNKYSFYNPKQHPFFDQEGGRRIFFEGTYVTTFSGNDNPTPRYDYNQIMYQLDLADSRVILPAAVYRSNDGGSIRYRFGAADKVSDSTEQPDFSRLAFFAWDRSQEGAVPVYETETKQGTVLTAGSSPAPNARPAFHACPVDEKIRAAVTTPLYEVTGAEGKRIYLTGEESPPPGFQRADRPLCRVGKNPYRP